MAAPASSSPLRKLALLSAGAYAAAAPLDNWVIPGLGTPPAVAAALLLATGTLYLATRGALRQPSAALWLLVAFLLWCCLSLLWTLDAEMTLLRVETLLQLALISFLLFNIARTEQSLDLLRISYASGALVLATATITAWHTGSTRFVYETRYVAEGFDPNEVGISIALALPLVWSLRIKGALLIKPLYFLIATFALFLTASRGALLTLVAIFLALIFSSRQTIVRRLASLTLLCFTIVSAALLAPDGAIARLLNFESRLGGRSEIWSSALQVLENQWPLGTGAGAFVAALERTTYSRDVAHNTFLSVLVETGPIGELLFIGGIFVTLYTCWSRRTNSTRLTCILLAAWILGVSSLSWEHKKVSWFVLAYAIAHARTERPSSFLNTGDAKISPNLTGHLRYSPLRFQ